jgi:hypothetical protein
LAFNRLLNAKPVLRAKSLKTKAIWFGKPIAGGANSLPNSQFVENKGVARKFRAHQSRLANAQLPITIVLRLYLICFVHVTAIVEAFHLGWR